MPTFHSLLLALAASLCCSASGATLVSTPEGLLSALKSLSSHQPGHLREVHINGPIQLSSTLILDASHTGLTLKGISAHASLSLIPTLTTPASVLSLTSASNVTLSSLSIGHSPLWLSSHSIGHTSNHPASAPSLHHGLYPAALTLAESTWVTLTSLVVQGGVKVSGGRHITLSHSNVSNPHGAQNGTCIYVPYCGHSPTLTPCDLIIHDNLVHDCRFDGKSPYVASAQGVLLGAQAGDATNASLACTVGVVVEHNNMTGMDEMGARVAGDYLCAAVNNQIVFNKIENWGQLVKGSGGDTTDSGCLYSYGHWYSPGNNFSYNYCISRNASWGQNGMYLDDASTGTTVVGNTFFNASGGVALKLNGGSYHTVANNLVIQGIGMGFAVCRGLRPPEAYTYTCSNNNTGVRWMGVLEANNYLADPWATAFPFYKGWCGDKTTAGPNNYPCAPPGAPPAYDCPILPIGSSVTLFGGVAMRRNSTFAIPTAPGFPYLNNTSPCANFVVDQEFNAVGESYFVEGLEDNFVDPASENWLLRPDAPLLKAAPGFQVIPFGSIGIRS